MLESQKLSSQESEIDGDAVQSLVPGEERKISQSGYTWLNKDEESGYVRSIRYDGG